MSTIIVRADVEIDTDDLDLDEIVTLVPTNLLKEELYNRGSKRSLLDIPDDATQTIGAIAELLRIRPEDRKNKEKIIEAIEQL